MLPTKKYIASLPCHYGLFKDQNILNNLHHQLDK